MLHPQTSHPAGLGPVRVESWLRDAAFPFWAEHGVDRAGPGFVEHLTLAGAPADVAFKRVRVQARQVFCFCQAAEFGLHPGATALAEQGVDLLLKSAWQGPEAGWVSTLTRSGEPLDRRPDLYDIAFVLFALGWWHRVTGDARVRPIAHQSLDFLGAHMRHPSGRGYLSRLGDHTAHLQNPHMHLTEAMLVLRDSTGDARFAAETEDLANLCLDRFYDPVSGTLAEVFDAGWGRDASLPGAWIEPGHHFEWVWLLHNHLGPRREERGEQAMRGLFDFALSHGVHSETSLVFNAVQVDGMPVLPDHRLWPQTERLKGWIAMAERFGLDASAALENGIDRIFRYYLDTGPNGTWIEHRTASLEPQADKIPTSSFYHLVLAFTEVLRHSRSTRSATR